MDPVLTRVRLCKKTGTGIVNKNSPDQVFIIISSDGYIPSSVRSLNGSGDLFLTEKLFYFYIPLPIQVLICARE